MKFYSITAGQLTTLWFFGVIFWLYPLFDTIGVGSSSLPEAFLASFIPGFLIFYSIGWVPNKKNE